MTAKKSLFDTDGDAYSGAIISKCGNYRYALWRTWELRKKYALFIGLNPSTADAEKDDPTIRRCIQFARSWGFGGINMLNLFAYRSTNPKVLKTVTDPIGQENDATLKKHFEKAGITIVCWGVRGGLMGRDEEVVRLLGGANLSCLGTTFEEYPCHPLYLPMNTKPVPFHF